MDLQIGLPQIMMIFILTVVLGYFLGITVSSVVDYRLKDATINLPITMRETFVGGSGETKKTKSKVKKNAPSKKLREAFTNPQPSKPLVADPVVLSQPSRIEKQIRGTGLSQCPEYVNDPHRSAFETSYKIVEKITRDDAQNFPFKGSNAEELDTMYESVEQTSLHTAVDPAKLPREKRCPQSKCQRPWYNCTQGPSVAPGTTLVNKV